MSIGSAHIFNSRYERIQLRNSSENIGGYAAAMHPGTIYCYCIYFVLVEQCFLKVTWLHTFNANISYATRAFCIGRSVHDHMGHIPNFSHPVVLQVSHSRFFPLCAYFVIKVYCVCYG